MEDENNLQVKRQLKRFLSAVETVNDRVGVVISFVVLAIAVIVAYEVIARFVFNRPTIWAFETVAMVFGVYSILTGGYVLLHNRHVRVDILLERLSSRGKAIADIATSGLGFLFVGSLVWYTIPFALASFEWREVAATAWRPPLYPIKIILVVGVSYFFLILIVKFIRDLYTAIK